MATHQLIWQDLLPNPVSLNTAIKHAQTLSITDIEMQTRLSDTIRCFCQQEASFPFMLINIDDSKSHLEFIAAIAKQYLPENAEPVGVNYQVNHHVVTATLATQLTDNFAAKNNCLYAEWFEQTDLMGDIIQQENSYQLIPGLVHKSNGGVLILSLKTLLQQPLLWSRLKCAVLSKEFRWYANNKDQELPLCIPTMPLNLRIILTGDSSVLSELRSQDPILYANSFYGEHEPELYLQQLTDLAVWMNYVSYIANKNQLPQLSDDIWSELLRQACRYTSHQYYVPICPVWIHQLLHRALPYVDSTTQLLTAFSLQQSQQHLQWGQGYLLERIRNEIYSDERLIDTENAIIGQINGLSFVEYPSHPTPFGEPCRITCTVHYGDGGLNDVERKAELAGNIHAKGMMIIEAFLTAELELEQNFPFSSSIVFEQSYHEVDGDSASLAKLCVLLSALSLQPITQSIAVTGALDQHGRVQAVGGINEKIEGFFDICQQKGLTGKHGVILPKNNLNHLCLQDKVIEAIKKHQFHLWPVEHVSDAVFLLTNIPYYDEQTTSILGIIQDRISQLGGQNRYPCSWFAKLFSKNRR